MILPTVNSDRFIELVSSAPLIAFQALEYGFAVAAPGEAYYAPLTHPGGGNLQSGLPLGDAFIRRMSEPRLRTLRPTAKPAVTQDLFAYLNSAFNVTEFDDAFKKAPGDHPAVVEYQCQVVIQAIEEVERPDLKDAILPVKREFFSDVLDLVIEHAQSARELAEVGGWDPRRFILHLKQCSTALQTAFEALLKP